MQFKHIIATVDVSDELAEKVLKAARSLAERDGAALEAVSVWPAPSTAGVGIGGEGGASAAIASQAILEQHKLGRETMQTDLKKLVAAVAPNAKAVILDGDPAHEVTDYAERSGVDLVVTGSHQRGFWGALLAGSASRELIHEAPCAVFVVTKRYAERL